MLLGSWEGGQNLEYNNPNTDIFMSCDLSAFLSSCLLFILFLSNKADCISRKMIVRLSLICRHHYLHI